jgi:molybdopterin-containing oxidoreductase family iron-sulfur binding subunit
MVVDRRGFLKMAGVAGLVTAGIALKPLYDVFTRIQLPEASKTAATVAGARWAMVIDPKACEDGCRECIDACHRVHNVPDFRDPEDEVKWIWNVPYENAFPNLEHEFIQESLKGRPVTVLCNHCKHPPCVRVCPTGATWKRKDGIVMMDYHRCIGCRYCMGACPYGARSFNWRDPRPFIKETNPDYPTRTKGVVEKCNFCAERLRVGLLPACVEACKEKGLVFGDLENRDSEVRRLLSEQYSIRRKSGLGTEPKVYYLI